MALETKNIKSYDKFRCEKEKKNSHQNGIITYVLNTGGEFKLAARIPTIFPSDKLQIINCPSGEMVKQSMCVGNAMTFVFWLLPSIKSFSSKCITLSMATTTFSLRNVARKVGSC